MNRMELGIEDIGLVIEGRFHGWCDVILGGWGCFNRDALMCCQGWHGWLTGRGKIAFPSDSTSLSGWTGLYGILISFVSLRFSIH